MNEKPDATALISNALQATEGWATVRSLGHDLKVAGHDLAQRSLRRRLAAMVEQGLVEQAGAGPSTRYRHHPVHAWFQVPAHARPPVPYDASRLTAYVPNETNWLTPDQKARLRAVQPPKEAVGSYPLAVAEKLMVDLSYASSVLEGNTYNYLDTETLVRYGQAATGKDVTETAMILNHKQAVGYLVEVAHAQGPLSSRTLKELHALLGQDLIDVRELGVLRRRPVSIGGSAYVPLAIPSRLEEEFNVLIEKANAIADPFEQSLFWLVGVAYLQPFVDINKRTGRLACNVPLLKAGLAPLSFMTMDKQAYVKGLLEYYELGATETMARAFEGAYVASAHRYDAHLSLDPEQAKIDRAYKQEIAWTLRSWVGHVVANDPERLEDVIDQALVHVSDLAVRRAVSSRIHQVLAGLNEANRIVYGIPHSEFLKFEQHASTLAGGAGAATPPSKPRTARSSP